VDPKLVGVGQDRWAEERQYLTNDVGKALAGRITLDGFLSVLAWHDDNHLDQPTRALQGRV
jgi:hypothetical protein